MSLHIQEDGERQKHLEALCTGMRLEIEEIENRKRELMAQKKRIENAKRLYQQVKEELNQTRQSERILKEKVDELKGDEVVCQAMNLHARGFQDGKHRGRSLSSAAVVPVPRSVASSPSPTEYSERPPIFNSSDDELDNTNDINDLLKNEAEVKETGSPQQDEEDIYG